ncbi:MAG: LytTR family transcriptional regulator [Prevotella sp.]|nr:LytTR family transcriptional regulator [Prevotella sp.]MBR6188467.1 LytTR family transcriptional regulator [Prevotella sp.]
MKQGRIETITTRIISTTFIVVALAVFKPFGLDAWQWQGYVHLIALGVIGFSICMMTDIILKYVIKMPRSFKKGAEYIIRRNLWFQLINTPLVALGICLYRHFVLSDHQGLQIPSNVFSVVNFLETLVIIAFCSFAIGLYWRFKFRSKYLAMELEEIRELNEQLKNLTPDPSPKERGVYTAAAETSADKGNYSPLLGRGVGGEVSGVEALTLSGTTNESVTLQISNLLFIEAVGNYVKVSHLRDGQVRTDMLRATMKQMEETLQGYPMIVRCHRAFLVNLGQVEQIVSHSGSTQLLIKHCHESLPVSRSNMSQVKAAISSSLICAKSSSSKE